MKTEVTCERDDILALMCLKNLTAEERVLAAVIACTWFASDRRWVPVPELVELTGFPLPVVEEAVGVLCGEGRRS